jgi:hypothetical protein
MSSAGEQGCTRTANNAISPDGTENAFTITASSTAPAYLRYSGIFTAGQSYAVSVYAKAGTNDIIRITNASSAASGQWFDLTNGTLLTGNGASNTATIQDVGNGWYRCTRYFDSVTVPSNDEIFVGNTNADGDTGAISGSTVHLYGFQIENNATSSSFIPTSGSSVSRAAETFTIPSANLPWPTPQYIGDELFSGATYLGNGWTDNGDGSYTSDGSDLGGTGRLNIVNDTVAGTVYYLTMDVSASSIDVRQGGTNIYSNLTTVAVPIVGDSGGGNINITANGALTVSNISLREINPLSVSIAMDGRMTYADENQAPQVGYWSWLEDNSNNLTTYLDCGSSRTGQIVFKSEKSAVTDIVKTSATYFSPDILVPYSIASRHGSTFVNGAESGVALTENTTPTALPDLSATDLDLASDYMGTIGTFRVWDKDLGDDGIVEATNPSLEPSLSLTFEGTGTNSFVVNNWAE